MGIKQLYKFFNKLFDKQHILLFRNMSCKTEKWAKPSLSLEFEGGKRWLKKLGYEYGKNTMGSQEVQGNKLNIKLITKQPKII